MAKRTPTAKKAPPVENADKLHDNEQTATSVASDVQGTFVFRFWDLGELTEQQGIEVGHDGAPVDMFVLDEVSFEAYKMGQHHQYIGGFGMTAARHLFAIPFKGTWYLAVRPVKEESRYDIAYRVINFN